MRDKYIELIKEYVREKPEYRYILNELKADVLSVGATEDEFDEAVKQVSGLSNASKILNEVKNPQRRSFAKTLFFKIKPAAAVFYETSLFHVKKRKKYVAGTALFIIIILSVFQTGKNTNINNKVINSSFPVQAPITSVNSIPVVYANTQTVDPNKIFSIPSKSVQLTITQNPKKEILGFFPYWMLPKEDQIDLTTLTSVSLFGLEVDGNGNIITGGNNNDQASGGWAMWKDPKLDDFLRRARNQNLKIYLTFKSFDNTDIEKLSESDTSQKNFIANALYFVNSKNLDGINIDFEYNGMPSDTLRNGFTRLITNLNLELKRQIPGADLTIDTYLVSGSEKDLFDIPILAQNSNAFVIMGYDMHTPLGGPGPVSAMGGDTNIVGYVQNYLEQVDASKLILAVPYYGYDWPLNVASPSADMVNILPYAEIAQQTQNLQLSWDETSQTPYFTYKDDTGEPRIVHFDNVRSLGIKYDFINKKNLKGVGIWALGYDGENQDLEKLLIDKFINQ